VKDAAFSSAWDTGKYMMSQFWTTFASASPSVLYDLFYGPSDAAGSFYDDSAVNESLRAARGMLDPAAGLAAFQSADATIAAAAPITPVAYWMRDTVCAARLHDAVLSPTLLFDFTRVWIQ
jgi:ABC-type transport system substrate-binding protein